MRTAALYDLFTFGCVGLFSERWRDHCRADEAGCWRDACRTDAGVSAENSRLAS